MNTIEAIQSRRSVKHFDPEHQMSDKERDEILSLAILSPSAFNIQHWRFVVADDAALREQLKAAAHGQEQVSDASMLVILCADLMAWQKQPARYWANAPDEVLSFMLPAIDNFYRDKEQTQRDEAMRSCGIAAQTLMLSAKTFGYDSSPMVGFDFEQVAQLIQLPDDHIITMFVAIGKGIQPARPRAGQLALNEVVIKNRFEP